EVVAPRIAQAEAPDLGPRVRRPAADERIAGRNGVADRMGERQIHVNPQHLAEQLRRILRAVRRVVLITTVAKADVEIAIGPKRKMTPVMVGEWLVDHG